MKGEFSTFLASKNMDPLVAETDLLLFMFSLVFVFLFMVRVSGGSILFLSFICFYFRFYLCLSVAEKNFFLEFCLGICSGQDLFLCRPICVAQYI